MRTAFSQALVQAARNDERLLLLTGDHGYSLFDEFRRVCPHQYLNAGVAEQNMVGVAAGLAKGGFRPIVYGLSAFVPIRVLEQIKLDVCYENLPVILVGDGAGVVYGQLGTSHQSTEDIAALRALPNIFILSPCDGHEMMAGLAWAIEASRPVYLRMGKADLGTIHSARPALTEGQPLLVQTGSGPLAWIATGSMVLTARQVARNWPGSGVWSCPFLKPLDQRTIAGICRRHRAVIVLEEHHLSGGLGAAIAEISAAECPTWVCRIGIRDRFSQYCGSYSYLMKEHELDPESVRQCVTEFLQKSGALRGLGTSAVAA